MHYNKGGNLQIPIRDIDTHEFIDQYASKDKERSSVKKQGLTCRNKNRQKRIKPIDTQSLDTPYDV